MLGSPSAQAGRGQPIATTRVPRSSNSRERNPHGLSRPARLYFPRIRECPAAVARVRSDLSGNTLLHMEEFADAVTHIRELRVAERRVQRQAQRLSS